MGKKFSNEDIDYHLQMGKKHGVTLMLLMIVGYPTESLADYEFTKQWFKDRKEFADNSVKSLNLSFASVLPGTELARKKQDLGVDTGKFPSIWINQNLKITGQQRKQYLLELQSLCTQLGFVCNTNEETLEYVDE